VVDEGGTILVEVTAMNGCSVEDSLFIFKEEGIAFISNFLTPDQACIGDTVRFFDISSVLVDATGYRWKFGDGTTSTERDPQHVYETPGTYDVGFTAFSAGCDTISISKPIMIFDCFRPTNPDDVFESIVAFPNPNNGNFQVDIQLNNVQPVLVSLYDYLGRKMDERSMDLRTSYTVEYQDLPTGFYTVQIQSQRKRKSVKVLVIEE